MRRPGSRERPQGALAREAAAGRLPVLDRFRLDGRVAVVTGASSGLGVAFAQALAEAGADVALGARRTDRLRDTLALVRDAGRRGIVVPTDVRDPGACATLVRRAVEELGGVDVLVNNAGIGTAVPAVRESPGAFRAVIDANVHGSFLMAQAAARVMPPGSSIVNLSSILALRSSGLPQAAYSASKAAIAGLTRDLAVQWGGPRGIRVNAVAPGLFPTEMTAGYPPERIARMLERAPIPRPGDPRELAATVVWLASPAGAYVTGQTILVEGGRAS